MTSENSPPAGSPAPSDPTGTTAAPPAPSRGKDPDALLNFLIGQVMRATRGRANPQVIRALLLERLDETKE